MSEVVTRPRLGEQVEVTVESLAFGGNGVARLGRYVIFVSGALPGEQVRAEITKRKRDYAQARVSEVLTTSPDRVLPEALHPGASWQILSYEKQLAVKQAQVAEALSKLAKLDDFQLEPIIPAVEQLNYRNKLEYTFGNDQSGELICGFHPPGRWDQVVAVEDCILSSAKVNQLRNQLLEILSELSLGAYDKRSREGYLRNLVIREGRRSGELQVRLVTSTGELPEIQRFEGLGITGLYHTQISGPAGATDVGETELLAGKEKLSEELCDLNFQISPLAFFQTNTEMAELLYGQVREYANLSGEERVFDVCCGIGTIGLVLAGQAASVVGIELVESAVLDATANAYNNAVTNTRFFAGDVRLLLRDVASKAGRPEVCVIDPPRSGLSKKALRRIIELEAKQIVYVSCNPTTLAANAVQLTEAGYQLTKVRPVDMFPQTPHIECVANFKLK